MTAPHSQGDLVRTKPLLVGIAATAGAFLMATTPAYAATTAVGVVKGKRLAGGAAVAITTTYSCPKGYGGELNISVIQSHGQQVNNASGLGSADCSGGTKTTSTAAVGTWVFKKGQAVVIATVLSCNADGTDCPLATTYKVINLP